MNTTTPHTDHIVELFVRPRDGGTPVSRGETVMRVWPSINEQKKRTE